MNRINGNKAKAKSVFILIIALVTVTMVTMLGAIKKTEDKYHYADAEVATITVTLDNSSVDYNGNAIKAKFSFKNSIGETVTIGDSHQTITYDGVATLPNNAKTYTVRLVIASASGYQINGGYYETSMTIKPRRINIEDGNVKVSDKTYNGQKMATVIAGTYTFSGVLDSDKTKVNIGAEANFNDENAGQAKVVIVNYILSGEKANNYYLSKVTTTISGNILKKSLQLDASVNIDSIVSENSKKIYDGTNKHPTFPSLKLSNVIPGELSQLYLSILYETAIAGDNIPITLSYVDNNEGKPYNSANYDLPSLTTKIFHGKIEKKAITLNKNKINIISKRDYDKTMVAEVTTQEGAFVGIVSGEVITPTVRANFTTPNVGVCNIDVSFGLNTKDSKNYTINEDYQIVGEIKARKIVLDNLDIEKIKEFDNTTVGVVKNRGIIRNLCIGDTVIYTIMVTFNNSSIGSGKIITVTFSELSNSNYSLPSAITFTDGEITKRKLIFDLPTIDRDKIYDGSSNLTKSGDIAYLNIIVGYADVKFNIVCSYSDALAGLDKTITISPIEGSLSGAHAMYYALPDEKTYKGSISKKKLTTSMTIEVEKEKMFDGTDKAKLKNDGTNIALNGIIGSDNVTCVVVANYNSEGVGLNKSIFISFVLSGEDRGNYEMDELVQASGGVITPRKLGITVGNNEFSYGKAGDITISYSGAESELLKLYPVSIEITYSVDGVYSISKPTEVGSYDIIIKILSSNYTTTDGSGSFGAKYIINQVQPTLIATNHTAEYNPNGFNLDDLLLANKDASNVANVILKVKFYFDAYLTNELNRLPSSAGEYYYVLYCDATINHGASISASKRIIINQKEAEITILNTFQKLDTVKGNAVDVVVAPVGTNFAVNYKINNSWLPTSPTSVGVYEVKVTIIDSNYTGEKIATFTIENDAVEIVILPNSSNITPTVPSQKYTAIYDKDARYSFKASCSDNTVKIKFTYATIAGDPLGYIPYESGSYIIRAEPEDSTRTGKAEVLFVIEKKDITSSIKVNPDTLNQFYDGGQKLIDAYCDDYPSVKFDYLIKQNNIELRNAIASGTYSITARASDKNYSGSVTFDMTIAKSKQTLIVKNGTHEYHFNGKRFRPEVLFEIKLIDGTSIELGDSAVYYEFITTTGTSLTAPSTKGDYSVRARFSDTSNYENTGLTEYVQFSIITTTINVEWLTAVYDSENSRYIINSIYDPNTQFSLRANDLKFTNGNNEEMNLFGVATIETLKDNRPVTPVSVGEYTLRITLAANENYNQTVRVIVLVIKPKAIDTPDAVIKVIKNKYEWGDKEAHILQIETTPTSLLKNIKIEYFIGEDRTTPIDEIGRTKPGVYVAVVTILDVNYSGVFEYKLIVNKRKVMVGISNNSTVYGKQQLPDINLSIDGESITTLDYIIEFYSGKVLLGLIPPINAGNYTVKVYIDDENYSGEATVEYIVAKAELKVTFNDITKTYDKKTPISSVKYEGFMYEDDEYMLSVKAHTLYNLANCINVGKYTIEPPTGSSDNYIFICSSGKVEITKASIFIAIREGLEMEEGRHFDLYGKDNYTISGLMEGDISTFRINPNLKIFNSKGEDVTSLLSTLSAGVYTTKLYGGVSDNYEISAESYLLSKEFIIFSNTIKSGDGKVVINDGKFSAGAVVYFNQLTGTNALYKATKKLTGKEIFGSKILATFELKVLAGEVIINSQTNTITLVFEKPSINFEKTPILYANINGTLQKINYTVNADNTLTIILPTANCALSFVEVVSYTWLIILIIASILGIFAIILIIKRVKFLKELPDEVEEKGTAIEVAPEMTEAESDASEESEFAELIKKAETGQLEERKEPEKPKPPEIKPTVGEPKKKDTVADRIVGLTIEKLKNEHEMTEPINPKKGN